jgi:5'-nucleotidase
MSKIHKNLAALAIAVGCVSPAAALNIALTNDDGWQAPGIWAMKYALEAAGHNVVLAASLTDQSGSSMAIDLESLAVTKQADNVFSVALWRDWTIGAKPANTANVGIAIWQESGSSPDLLISGINTSANIGLAALISGTVSAAVHASLAVLNGPVPALAVGTDVPKCDTGCQWAHYQKVADFVARFVAHLQTKPGVLAREAGILPAGIGLIISHPGTSEVKGIRVAEQSASIMAGGAKVSGGFNCATPCSGLATAATVRARFGLVGDATPEPADSDLRHYMDGYITIVPVVGNVTAASPMVFKSIIPGLTQ